MKKEERRRKKEKQKKRKRSTDDFKQMLVEMDLCSSVQMIAALLEFNQGMQKREVRDGGTAGEGRRGARVESRLKIR